MASLRALREAAGMTQEKLSKKVHMSECELGSVERGYRLPWPHEAQTIAEVLGVAVDALFPDGFKVKKDLGNNTKAARAYLPPDESEPVLARPVRRYPRSPFTVMCWHCRKMVAMCGDDQHSPFDSDPHCPECGAIWYDIMPTEEAHVGHYL